MPLTKEQVIHLADLASIKLSPKEIDKMPLDLEVIEGYLNQIGEVDCSDIAPWRHYSSENRNLRVDKIVKPLSTENALKNTKSTDNLFFLVPKVIS